MRTLASAVPLRSPGRYPTRAWISGFRPLPPRVRYVPRVSRMNSSRIRAVVDFPGALADEKRVALARRHLQCELGDRGEHAPYFR